MPRRAKSGLTKDGSTVIAIRVDGGLVAAMRAAAGGDGALAEWCRAVFRQAISYDTALGASFADGVQRAEGWRAGWTAANRQFREALTAVLRQPPPEA